MDDGGVVSVDWLGAGVKNERDTGGRRRKQTVKSKHCGMSAFRAFQIPAAIIVPVEHGAATSRLTPHGITDELGRPRRRLEGHYPCFRLVHASTCKDLCRSERFTPI